MSNEPPQEPPDPLFGTELNGYQIRSVMGEGGMGKVYLGVHPLVGAKAAIKVMLPQFADDREQAERFVKEARVLAQLNHDRIVKIMGFGNLPDGRLYMITEHLEGASLARIIERESPMPPAKALNLIDQILDALSAAHAAGVVHRDLKPHNVIVKTVGAERKLKLFDFGLARARVMEAPADPSMPLNKVSQVMGTPEYMAPEQCMGKAPSPASDLYSLGVILFELLANRLPFLANNVWEMMKAHVNLPAPRAGVLVPSLPQPLDDLVAQLLSKVPEERGAPSERVRKMVQGLMRDLPEPEVAGVRKASNTTTGEFRALPKPGAGEGSNPRAAVPQEVRRATTGERKGLSAAQIEAHRAAGDAPARPSGGTNPRNVMTPEMKRVAGLAPNESPLPRPGSGSTGGHKMSPELRRAALAAAGEPPESARPRGGTNPRNVMTPEMKRVAGLTPNESPAPKPGSGSTGGHKMSPELRRAALAAAGEPPESARPKGGTNPRNVMTPEMKRVAGAPPAEPPSKPVASEAPLDSKSPSSGQVRVDPSWAAAREKAMPQAAERSSKGKVLMFLLALVVAALIGIGADRFTTLRKQPAVVEIPVPPSSDKPPLLVPKEVVVAPPMPEVAVHDAGADGASVPVALRPKVPDRDPVMLCKDVPQWRTDVRTNMRMLGGIFKAAHPDAPEGKGPLAELAVLREMSLSVVDVAGCAGVQHAVDVWEATYAKSTAP